MFTEDEIKQRTAQLLAATGLGAVFPLPVEKVAEYLGFECHFYIPDEDIDDIAGAVSHSKRKIYVNQNNSFFQQRACIAAKVGCIVLHGANKDYIGYLRGTNDPQERAAQSFAQNLLMPEAIFREKWHETQHDIDQLVQFFGVSQFAILERASSLHLR